MKAFMSWPLILTGLLVVTNILVYFTSIKAGIILSVALIIYVGMALLVLRCHRPFIINDLIAFANRYDVLEKEFLRSWPCPMPLWIQMAE